MQLYCLTATKSSTTEQILATRLLKLIARVPGCKWKFIILMKPVIRIDIASDVVCPWCYIGKRRLEKAVEQMRDQFDFSIHYHPFELNPQMPAEGKDQVSYLSNKFGGRERYDQLTQQVTDVAATEGIEFNYSKQKISPNTRNAHRVVWLAEEHGVQQPVVEALFKAYFTDGVDLSSDKNLITIATQAGLPKEAVETLFSSDKNLAEVITAEAELQKLGISGVPFYIINNKYGISGAQSPKTFAEAFMQVANEVQVTGGESCSVDDPTC
jgi:predicted DsbA family dithiol-disulfide isomerase